MKDFESCFTTNELEALRKFHEYFNVIVKDIDTSLPLETIQKNPKWVNLGKEASKALKEFGLHPTNR